MRVAACACVLSSPSRRKSKPVCADRLPRQDEVYTMCGSNAPEPADTVCPSSLWLRTVAGAREPIDALHAYLVQVTNHREQCVCVNGLRGRGTRTWH
eukprot:1007110-Prymnesium_polylepis.2